MRANGVQHFALAVGQGGLVRLLLGEKGMVLTSGSFRYVTSITCCSCEIKHLFEFRLDRVERLCHYKNSCSIEHLFERGGRDDWFNGDGPGP